MQPKIVIRREDLDDPRVDDLLRQQLSFGMAAAPVKVADKKSGLLYRSWFVLMLAGGLGGFAGWAIIEPFFEDGVRFRGTLERIDLGQVMGEPNTLGVLDVSGNQVWLGREVTQFRRDGKPSKAEELAQGQVVEVQGELYGLKEREIVVATVVNLLPADHGAYQQVKLSSLSLKNALVSFALFPLIAGLVGLFVGAADGLVSRALRRAALCALVGLSVGIGLGLIATLLADLVYGLGTSLVAAVDTSTTSRMSTPAFITQMISRGIAWSFAGAGMGLGQGIALRAKKLLLNGLVGGMVGALLGGLLFDPIDYLVHGGHFGGGAEVSRCVGIVIIGLATGLMIGIVELLAREAWIKMLTGPIAGKEFVVYKNPTSIGSSPKADVYLFKDPEVEPVHALLHTMGEGYELEDKKSAAGSFVNGHRVARRRLANGDQVRIGKTVFSFSLRDS